MVELPLFFPLLPPLALLGWGPMLLEPQDAGPQVPHLEPLPRLVESRPLAQSRCGGGGGDFFFLLRPLPGLVAALLVGWLAVWVAGRGESGARARETRAGET